MTLLSTILKFYSSTEAGSLSAVVPKSTTVEHWRYFKFSGHFKAHITSSHMVDGEEVGELVVLVCPFSRDNFTANSTEPRGIKITIRMS